MTDFALWIIKQIEKRKINPKELITKAGISRYTLMKITNGEVIGPRIDTVQAILGAMGAHLEIVDDDGGKRWKI